MAEYLAALEAEAEANPDRKPPKVISPRTRSAWTAKANKRVQFGYGLNYLIDIENAVIVDVEATPARTYDEVAATKTMLDRTQERFGLKPKRLAADTAYGTGKFLGWLIGAKITPHIPVWDKSDREDGTSHARTFAGTSGEASTSAPTKRCSRPAAPCTTDDTALSRLQARLRCLRAQGALLPRAKAQPLPKACQGLGEPRSQGPGILCDGLPSPLPYSFLLVLKCASFNENYQLCFSFRGREAHSRSFAKAVSWRVTGTIDTFVISAIVTGKATRWINRRD